MGIPVQTLFEQEVDLLDFQQLQTSLNFEVKKSNLSPKLKPEVV